MVHFWPSKNKVLRQKGEFVPNVNNRLSFIRISIPVETKASSSAQCKCVAALSSIKKPKVKQ
jgi:hypothetical protein